ncbi:MAG: MBL fold metallo-hydrolase [Anaerolineaceae bacterium]|nr:MBL fold metallo-hydrolase [Anaerolineaceae bacterium]
MDILQISDNILHFHFPNKNDPERFSNCIFALLNGSETILIDTAYADEAKEVKDYLDKEGFTVKKTIISHFHPDHFEGCKEFPDSEIWISKDYHFIRNFWQTTYPDEYIPLADHEIIEGEELVFGHHILKFNEAPGHSHCSLITNINNLYIHTGDLLLITDKGILSIPYMGEDGSHSAYLSSLNFLDQIKEFTILPAHGFSFRDSNRADEYISRTRHYIQNIIESRGKTTVESCLPDETDKWANLYFHKYNIKHFED